MSLSQFKRFWSVTWLCRHPSVDFDGISSDDSDMFQSGEKNNGFYGSE